jgi:mRNA turnover protein 4
MPKSKRSRIVHTSKVQKKPTKANNVNQYTTLRTAATQYPHILLFSVQNMRNNHLKTVRQTLSKDSRLFFGKTKVMAKALGLTAEEEAMPGLHKLSALLKGDVGVICTQRSVDSVLEMLEEFVEVDFARAGTKSSRRFTVPEGVVYSTAGEMDEEEDVPLPHSLEATVRKWGMPTRLEKGRVMLDQEYVVCRKGKTLNSNQTALLKIFGCAMAEFRVRVVGHWGAETGEVVVLDEPAGDVNGDVSGSSESDVVEKEYEFEMEDRD